VAAVARGDGGSRGRGVPWGTTTEGDEREEDKVEEKESTDNSREKIEIRKTEPKPWLSRLSFFSTSGVSLPPPHRRPTVGRAATHHVLGRRVSMHLAAPPYRSSASIVPASPRLSL
jgi:hypothetical protein